MGIGQRALRLILNRNFALAAGFVLGLVAGGAAPYLQPLTLPALGLLILVTASEVSARAFLRWPHVGQATLVAILSSYVLGTGAILLLARLITPEPDLYTGYVLVAAAPPAASALGFCIVLGGDAPLSLVGSVGAYLASLILGPLIALLFAGPGLIDVRQLFITLLELVAVPLALSRLARNRRVLPVIRRWRNPLIGWAYALVLYVVVGVNRSVFFSQPLLILRVALVAVGASFGLGAAVGWVLRRLGVDRRRRISLTLLATLKNSGFAAAVALALVSRQASLPGAVTSVVISLYLIYLGYRAGRAVHSA